MSAAMQRPLVPMAVFATALLGWIALPSCDRTAHAGGGTSATATHEHREYSYEQREEFRADMQSALDRLEAKVAETRAKAKATGQQVKAETQELIDDVEAKLPELRRKLSEAGTATREGWKEFSQKLRDGVDDLVHRVDRAFH